MDLAFKPRSSPSRGSARLDHGQHAAGGGGGEPPQPHQPRLQGAAAAVAEEARRARAGSARTGRRNMAARAGTRRRSSSSRWRWRAPTLPYLSSFSIKMVAPVLMKYGSDAQKKRFLPEDRRRRGAVVPGLFRAGLGLRPRQPAHQGRARGRPLHRQRPEDLDHRCAIGPTGSSAWCAPIHEGKPQEGISFLLIDMKTPGITVRADHHDGRRPRGERGVLRQREGARSPTGRQGEQGLDLRQVPARVRARRPGFRAAPAQGVPPPADLVEDADGGWPSRLSADPAWREKMARDWRWRSTPSR